jgi:hypothetical protein
LAGNGFATCGTSIENSLNVPPSYLSEGSGPSKLIPYILKFVSSKVRM